MPKPSEVEWFTWSYNKSWYQTSDLKFWDSWALNLDFLPGLYCVGLLIVQPRLFFLFQNRLHTYARLMLINILKAYLWSFLSKTFKNFLKLKSFLHGLPLPLQFYLSDSSSLLSKTRLSAAPQICHKFTASWSLPRCFLWPNAGDQGALSTVSAVQSCSFHFYHVSSVQLGQVNKTFQEK